MKSFQKDRGTFSARLCLLETTVHDSEKWLQQKTVQSWLNFFNFSLQLHPHKQLAGGTRQEVRHWWTIIFRPTASPQTWPVNWHNWPALISKKMNSQSLRDSCIFTNWEQIVTSMHGFWTEFLKFLVERLNNGQFSAKHTSRSARKIFNDKTVNKKAYSRTRSAFQFRRNHQPWGG